ncbi:alpha/beta hydrolase [Microbacteriaceae bacterium VKM Ac-2854]|nr:alpha/beta hydrolase [Microbacteriaceae bacterium VKM Ac-2854]
MPRFRAYDGESLYYDAIGDAALAPLIVLSGGPGRHPLYLGSLQPLAARRRLIVLHQRGVGESIDSRGASFAEMADDVEALREHLGLDSVDVFAHSAGCRIALVHAAAHPGRVDRLALITPAATWLVPGADDTAQIAARHAGAPWYAQYRAALSAYARATTWEERDELFPLIAPASWAEWDETARRHERIGAWYPAAQAAFYGPVDTDAVIAGLARFTGSALVVAGEEDGLSGLEPALALAEMIPNAAVATIEACGHYPWVERPAEFAVAMRSFLTHGHAPEPRGRRG